MTAPGMLWGSRGIYLETTSTLANNLQLALVLNISKSPLRRRLIALFQDKQGCGAAAYPTSSQIPETEP